ncbi:Ca2+-dependent phospholipid-binding protein Synaptotagmin [Handroanthus impetiginosus]|uniref:Ca2+-dependent phospholipid-binding protein Synaptotagmin n=1 Tax=Handroanthus impetiginosus TaxID=429701 RepID=A0A2G9G659_9LAMI|nr:Ca2+-dependent phospholipid-binding protein Synaptotagmin [Handroanthus impetiginosus]
MANLVVEVLEANDLMPKDGHGSASPFVEVEFQGQRQRTSTKPKTLNPSWNEKLIFNVKNPQDIPNQTIEVVVYNDNKRGHHKNFLGRVRISGISIPLPDQDILVQKYPLDKRGIFSHVKGDIALKVYASTQLEEINTTPHYNEKNKKKKKVKEVKSFHSLAAAAAAISGGGDGGATTVMQTQSPQQKSEYAVVETKPPLAARLGYWGRDKTASTYDLVEPMNFLYVHVVKAMDLPVKDVTGSLDPYVEVKVGNYKGVTRHFEKNQSPVWDKVFAFSKERLQSSLIEVFVKDKDISKDDFVGKVTFDVPDVPERVPPDSPLAPQWYKLVDKKGDLLKRGDIMLAVWMGTQADEAYPDAWHSDAHDVSQSSMNDTRSKVYFSPKLCYLRVHIFSAQDLVPADDTRELDPIVRIELGTQGRTTRPATVKGVNPEWNDELMYVAWEPFNENVVVSVEDKNVVIGRAYIPLRNVKQRAESAKFPDAQWFPLIKIRLAEDQEEAKKDKFASRILLRLSLDAGYHVHYESTQFSSDLQPSAKILRKSSIGILEVGILGALAKYGNKWVRTRTLLDNLHPCWNEQYTWEVFDPCTVITIGVFDNCHINGGDSTDQRMGKLRIRLSTLESDRLYTHAYPLLVITPSGLKKNGELHLAIRFTCTAWSKMIAQYGKPLLPKMHYIQPISIKHIDLLRHHAINTVAAKLSRAEPPLRTEVVEYMVDVDAHIFSMRRSKANFHRMMLLFTAIQYIYTWFEGISLWKNPLTTILVHILFLILVCYPELILPTCFIYLFVIGLWNYQFRPRDPPHMDARLSQAENARPDEIDEEFDNFPTKRETDVVRNRYDRLRTVAGRVQSVAADAAIQGERVLALLNWRDPRATAIFIVFSLIWAVFLYVTPFQIVVLLIGLYIMRHPKLRYKMPPVPVNFFKRLPSRSDSLL